MSRGTYEQGDLRAGGPMSRGTYEQGGPMSRGDL